MMDDLYESMIKGGYLIICNKRILTKPDWIVEFNGDVGPSFKFGKK